MTDKNGDYQEQTTELLGYLIQDFRVCPQLLHAVAKFHTGALIVDNDTVFEMTAEAYGRAKSVDIHGETNMKSFPSPANCVYGSLAVGVHEEVEAENRKSNYERPNYAVRSLAA